MKRWMSVFLTVTLLTALLAPPVGAADRTAGEIRQEILQYNVDKCGAANVQEWLDTALCESAGLGAEWYTLALVQDGEEHDFTKYITALDQLVHTRVERRATARQKNALLFLGCGAENDFIDTAATDTIGELGLMSWIYGLHLANNGAHTEPGREEVLATILSLQNGDGGWALSGDVSDNDVTAMALQALAACREESRECADAIERAVDFLAREQLPNGGCATHALETPESTAMTIMALAALGIDAFRDERFQKDGHTLLDSLEKFRLEDGSYAHLLGGETDGLATVEVLCAMVAYERQQQGKSGIYLFEKGAHVTVISPAEENDGAEEDTSREELPALPELPELPAEENGSGSMGWLPYVLGGAVAVLLLALVLSRRGKEGEK